MMDPANVPEVEGDERLARYVFHRSHLRRSNGTLKADAFMPPPNRRFSVTRHLLATEQEVWLAGEAIGKTTGRQLYGRGDITVAVCLSQNLTVGAEPVPDNPNHANILGWPPDKASQKIIAQEIAATAAFVEKP